MSRPLVPDHRTAVLLGVALVVAGSWLLHNTFEASGRRRPLLMSLVPGIS